MPPSVLITGASGGFGREFARQLEREGYRLLLHGRDRPRLQLALDALQHPERHQCLLADLVDPDQIEPLLQQIETEKQFVGLVNNAGCGVWGAFEQSEIIAQTDVLHIDLLAPIRLAHALLPTLIAHNGFMINVSSLAGETPLPYMGTYAAAKAGLTYWSEALRMETQGRMAVVTLAPGPSPTGFRDVSGMPPGKGSGFRMPAKAVVSASLHTLRRGGGYCVPAVRHKLLLMLQKLVPRRLSLAVMARHLRH